jgi:protoporphyrin/coproporphyrin ferrochelatase
MKKTAIILFNLGGPDSLKTVKPFLFNLFNDPAIIGLPQPLRWIVAKLITCKRGSKARGIYQQMGGKSPILDHTLAQAEALEEKLKSYGEHKVFTCMRYWHPMSDAVAKNVKAYGPDQIILLPLYPQYSTTTTASSFADWDRAAENAKLKAQTARICCYPQDFSFVAAHVRQIKDTYWKAADEGKPRVLFSAHGLPEKVINGGDPYQWQVEKTVASIVQIMAVDELDWRVCYQSKVGPLSWIGPSTEEEIMKAGQSKTPLVIVPVSFVSEHSETLVELDVDYRKLATEHGAPNYWRVPAIGTDPLFIEALSDLCLRVAREKGTFSFNKERYCTRNFEKCPCQ